MSNNKRTKYYYVNSLRKYYQEGRLDASQVERLKAIGFDFNGWTFDTAKDSLAAQYPAIAKQWDMERNGDKTPSDVRPLSTKAVWWRCPACDRPYKLQIRSKVINNGGCPYCGYDGTRAKVSLPVIRLDTLKSYPSIRSAEREVGYGITNAIANSIPDKKGVTWCYLIDYELGKIPHFAKRNRFESVICLETGQRFETQKQAELEFGISRGSISRVLDTDRTVKGYHWVTENNYDEIKAAAAKAVQSPYKVICLETGTQYQTYADAARDFGISSGNIQQAVKRDSHYTTGYHFVDCVEYSALSREEIKDILKNNSNRAVACVETGTRYESITAASKAYPEGRQPTARSRIGACCRDPYSVFDDKHWCYLEDLQLRKDNADKYSYAVKTAVRCIETGKEYESLAAASRDTGICANSIRLVAKGMRRKAGGFTWEYVSAAPNKRCHTGGSQPSAKKVRCIETGTLFISLNDAARAVGLKNGNSIRRAIDRCGTAGNYHWKYANENKADAEEVDNP